MRQLHVIDVGAFHLLLHAGRLPEASNVFLGTNG